MRDSCCFDYIIVGAGSAGCVLASRLSEDPSVSVVLIEAGGKDTNPWIGIPAGTSRIVGRPEFDWNYVSEPEPFIEGRRMPVPRGRTLGGSSSINGMVYVRGQMADFDEWRAAGNPGWGWDDVLPYFLKAEDYRGPVSLSHGLGGPLSVEPPRMRWPVLRRLRDAALSAGLQPSSDMAMSDKEICGFMDVTQRRGRRCSTSEAYLKPATRRQNLVVLANSHVGGVLLDGRKACGVDIVSKDGRRTSILARREVLLSAGAIGSPALLQRSGIGPANHLKACGVTVHHELKGVGSNLQDHLSMRFAYRLAAGNTLNSLFHNPFRKAWMGIEYALFRTGPLCMGAPPLAGFARSDPSQARPNVQFLAGPFSFEMSGMRPHKFDAISGGIYNLRPSSRGTVLIRSSDPDDSPAVLHNYLQDPGDQQVAIDSLRLMARIFSSPAMASLLPERFRPPSDAVSDEELMHYGKAECGTAYHPASTCTMGSSASSVVDASLRVHGMHGLRVVDASIMPTITSGNTNAPTIMIAEKAAEIIKSDWR